MTCSKNKQIVYVREYLIYVTLSKKHCVLLQASNDYAQISQYTVLKEISALKADLEKN